MKRLALAALLTLLAFPALAVTRTVLVVDDVIRMSKAGVADEEIITFLQKRNQPFEINGDDVLALTDANVSRAVIKAVIDEAEESRDREEARDERPSRVVVRPAPYSYYGGYYGSYYDPFYRSYYSPYWYGYGPRISVGFGFGPRVGYGYRHRGHRRHR